MSREKSIWCVLFALEFVLANVANVANGSECKGPIARTKNGAVRGIYERSASGRTFASFRAIPYARPPVGDLRFKDPQPAEPWSTVLDASREGPYCIQRNYYIHQNPPIEGQEDCLYLNVYSPNAGKTGKQLPVMVSIHFGGFGAYRGTSDLIGPKYFMDKDVVLVSFNYRLGAFGFLSTWDDSSPGNYGLKDQTAALQWVQSNIVHFGGDPTRVTIFGQSAGAASVHAHILSPLSRNLFHRGISQSGSALAVWAAPIEALQVGAARSQAAFVGCANATSAELVRCLRGVPAREIAASAQRFKFLGMDPSTVFTPAVETRTSRNPRPFFTKLPLEYMEAGEFRRVPWIVGTVRDEGIVRVAMTIFGQSAGAASVHAHILSPLSRNMFHSGISQSGSALAVWAAPIEALQVGAARSQAAFVGCANATSAELVRCLHGVPAREIAASAQRFKYLGMDPSTVFTPAVETRTRRNPRPFFTKRPVEYMEAGEFRRVPWIMGTVRDEGIVRVASLVRQKKQLLKFNANYEALLPEMIVLTPIAANVTDALDKITNFYLQGRKYIDVNDPRSIQGIIDLYTDCAITHASYQTVMLHSAKGHRDIWWYEFDYRGEYTYGDSNAATNETVNFQWGVDHGDDLLYLLNQPSMFPPLENPTSLKLRDLMVTMWTNFATNGRPTNSEFPGGLRWEPQRKINSMTEMKNKNLQYLKIGGSARENRLTMEILEGNFKKERMQFWTRLNTTQNFPGLD